MSGDPDSSPNDNRFWKNMTKLIRETNFYDWLQTNGNPVWVVFPIAATVLGLVGTIQTSRIIRSQRHRYRTADDFTTKNFDKRERISGIVMRCGDGDGFRLYHMPKYQYLKWKLFGPSEMSFIPPTPPELDFLKNTKPEIPRVDGPKNSPFSLQGPPIPVLTKTELTNETISIRLAAVDAPECAHFGSPEQKWGPIVRTWLQNKLIGQRIEVDVLSRDQYGRILGYPWLPNRFFGYLNIPLYMAKNGLAVVYHGHGEDYNGFEDKLLAAEANAKKKNIGLWQDPDSSPMEFKKQNK